MLAGAPPLEVGVDTVAVGPGGQGAGDEEGTAASVALEAAADAALGVAATGSRWKDDSYMLVLVHMACVVSLTYIRS